jgi:hypothetical protein
MTQLARVSEARRIELGHVTMTVTACFEQIGSIGADDIQSRLSGVETRLELESDAPVEKVTRLVRTAERMCFLMDAIREPHSVSSTVLLNGEPLDSEA